MCVICVCVHSLCVCIVCVCDYWRDSLCKMQVKLCAFNWKTDCLIRLIKWCLLFPGHSEIWYIIIINYCHKLLFRFIKQILLSMRYSLCSSFVCVYVVILSFYLLFKCSLIIDLKGETPTPWKMGIQYLFFGLCELFKETSVTVPLILWTEGVIFCAMLFFTPNTSQTPQTPPIQPSHSYFLLHFSPLTRWSKKNYAHLASNKIGIICSNSKSFRIQ